MNISQTYEKYMTPKNLQIHMLRVAALAKIITDNWTGPEIDKLSIIKALTMHDVAKPVAFDIAKQKSYGMSEQEISDLEKLQKLIKENFGTDEHKAATEMCRDMDLGEKAVYLVENLEWHYLPLHIKENNLEALICVYCDMRIGPNGIMSLNDRIDNLASRTTGYDIESFHKYGPLAEELIQKNTKKDLNSITDPDLNSLFLSISETEI